MRLKSGIKNSQSVICKVSKSVSPFNYWLRSYRLQSLSFFTASTALLFLSVDQRFGGFLSSHFEGIEESVKRKIENCKVTDYEDLKHAKCYSKKTPDELISAQLVSKENKYLTLDDSSYGIWKLPFTFEFKGIRYYLYIGAYEGYTFLLKFSVDGKVYSIVLPRKCEYFDVYPVS